MREGAKTAIAVFSIISYVICFFISLALAGGTDRSWVVSFFVFGIFAFLIASGVAMVFGHGGFLLSGWNTMTPEEKTRYDKKDILRFGGILVIVGALGTMLSLVSFINHVPWLGWMSIAMTLIIMFAGAVHMSKDEKFYSV